MNKFYQISFLSVIFILLKFILSSVLLAQFDESYLEPPQIVLKPESHPYYYAQNRTASGIPGLAVSEDGRLWATWYTGITPVEKVERCPANYVVVAKSDDGGDTWQEVMVIDPDGPGPVRAYDPQLWVDPEGKLWIFWSQEIPGQRQLTSQKGRPYGVWALIVDGPELDDLEFREPNRLTDGVMMNKPVVLSSGEWVLPVSTWKFTDDSAKMVVSTDKGTSWQVRGGVNVPEQVRSADEHMIVERDDQSLWMLVRTKYGIGESVSHDRGYTWSSLKPSSIQHPTARFYINRLRSGHLLLVKHGPIKMQINRYHLMAFISKDDGKTWSDGLLLDEGRTFPTDISLQERKRVSYPDGQQAEDGTIYITYDYARSEDQLILMISFTEKDILSGSLERMIQVHNNRRVISRGGVEQGDK